MRTSTFFRGLVVCATFLLVAAALGGCSLFGRGGEAKKASPPTQGVPPVSPPEDLMREHGVLNRVLLIYEDVIRRIDEHREVPPETLAAAADIIRNFVEDYHEKLEEDYIFPRFEKANRLVELTQVLRAQHKAGRELTGEIKRLATAASLANADDRAKLADALRRFIRMYRPHEAREDTVLFPASREIVTADEFYDLGEKFEDKENELFGEHGFEQIVAQVAELEKTLGIFDLAQFTPGS
jgi:hemerythrin-like domain-containing protein